MTPAADRDQPRPIIAQGLLLARTTNVSDDKLRDLAAILADAAERIGDDAEASTHDGATLVNLPGVATTLLRRVSPNNAGGGSITLRWDISASTAAAREASVTVVTNDPNGKAPHAAPHAPTVAVMRDELAALATAMRNPADLGDDASTHNRIFHEGQRISDTYNRLVDHHLGPREHRPALMVLERDASGNHDVRYIDKIMIDDLAKAMTSLKCLPSPAADLAFAGISAASSLDLAVVGKGSKRIDATINPMTGRILFQPESDPIQRLRNAADQAAGRFPTLTPDSIASLG